MSPLSSGVRFWIYSRLIPSNFMALLNSSSRYTVFVYLSSVPDLLELFHWMPGEQHSPQIVWHPLPCRIGNNGIPPFLGEAILDALQICHSWLSWSVSDVSLPELIGFSWTEEIPGICSTPVLRCRKVQFVILKNIPDGLPVHACTLIHKYCPHSPVSVCWPF